MSSQVFSRILIIIILLIFVGGGILAWQYFGVQQIRDKTADWQTYRNEEYGFEIKYPKELDVGLAGQYTLDRIVGFPIYFENNLGQLIEVENLSLQDLEQNKFPKEYTQIVLDIQTGYASIEQWFNEQKKRMLGSEFSKQLITMGGIEGYRLVVSFPKERANFIAVFKNGKVYELRQLYPSDCGAGDCIILSQMLSTFRFLD